ncbi:shikimate dehydrogenase [Rhizobium sp. L1K21]|uniref:shikimate dehydrogenase n=1 Tax=Rhizobium sp. L1K21 TaxID=2954933 RepID=UPI0020927522|nr:shikimate dehydrogenase [Rhizobium sp. L1K21]MCO6188003.1 shikimate dehydrogenase [Rhizobium sp. L1K21]
MRDSRETCLTKAFVAGFPIKHSRSPLIHNYWLSRFGMEGTYITREVSPDALPDFIAKIRSGEEPFAGGNFTIPHKEAICRLADVLDPLAEEIGAANTLWMEDGRLHVTNTDSYGFSANLDANYPGWADQKTAIIYGAGGASRAVVQAIRNRGFSEIHVLNRTVERARELSDHFGQSVFAHPLDALDELMKEAGLFVNTTSLSMNDQDVPKIDFTSMAAGALVTDIVYVPLKTSFLKQAEEQGLATVDGLGMLLHQAVPGFEKWFGKRPSVDAELRNIVIADMEKHA